jgi:hypothetical protein
MELPCEILHHIISFLPIDYVTSFAFVCKDAFEVVQGFGWEYLDFRSTYPSLEEVRHLRGCAKATCRRLVLPTVEGGVSRIRRYKGRHTLEVEILF